MYLLIFTMNFWYCFIIVLEIKFTTTHYDDTESNSCPGKLHKRCLLLDNFCLNLTLVMLMKTNGWSCNVHRLIQSCMTMFQSIILDDKNLISMSALISQWWSLYVLSLRPSQLFPQAPEIMKLVRFSRLKQVFAWIFIAQHQNCASGGNTCHGRLKDPPVLHKQFYGCWQ